MQHLILCTGGLRARNKGCKSQSEDLSQYQLWTDTQTGKQKHRNNPQHMFDACYAAQEGLLGASAIGAAQLLPGAWLQLLRMLLHAAVPPSVLRQLASPAGEPACLGLYLGGKKK